MKVKVIKDCYYNLELIKAGRIIDFKGKKLPSWATLADGIETKKEKKIEKAPEITPEEVKEEAPEEVKEEAPEEVKEEAGEEKAPDAAPDEIEYLNKLIDESVDKGILIEDTDKKTVKEQIKELEKALGK